MSVGALSKAKQWTGVRLSPGVAAVPQPVLGPRARAAMGAPVDGTKRRKLLVLLAAYADAGEQSPPMRELSARLGLWPHVLDSLLARLESVGWLKVEWAANTHAGPRPGGGRRNRYELRIGPHSRADHRWEAA